MCNTVWFSGSLETETFTITILTWCWEAPFVVSSFLNHLDIGKLYLYSVCTRHMLLSLTKQTRWLPSVTWDLWHSVINKSVMNQNCRASCAAFTFMYQRKLLIGSSVIHAQVYSSIGTYFFLEVMVIIRSFTQSYSLFVTFLETTKYYITNEFSNKSQYK